MIRPQIALNKGFTTSIIQSIRNSGTFAKEVNVPMLDRPIGVVDAPKYNDNDGVDRRSLKQKKEDMLNYDKHMERRKELEYELGKGFDDVKHFRKTGGKFWAAPPAYFRPDKALHMPNLWGKNLLGEYTTTTPLIEGKVSIMRLFSAISGENQVKSFTDDNDLHDAQIIDVNLPDSAIKEALVNLFKFNIRKQISKENYDKYFITRKGFSNEIKRAIRAENPYAGYIYLIDKQCRIRWAACGQATLDERAMLSKFVQSLKKE